jgi:hypothetical protein
VPLTPAVGYHLQGGDVSRGNLDGTMNGEFNDLDRWQGESGEDDTYQSSVVGVEREMHRGILENGELALSGRRCNYTDLTGGIGKWWLLSYRN